MDTTPPILNPWKIFGHDWAVTMLQQHLAHDSLRHAYLLTGPAGIGRRTLALRLAQAINCPTPAAPGVPCQTCRTCQQIAAEKHIDLMVLRRPEDKKDLTVEPIRELTRLLVLKPFASQFKIALLLNFEDANSSAQNALLKTLEEAPAHVRLLLTANNPEQLLPTIVSRCEILRLRPLPIPSVIEFLTRQGLNPEQAHLFGHLSGGRPGYALQLSQNQKQLAFRAEKLADIRALLSAKRRERMAYAEILAKDKESFHQTLLLWLSFWRDVMLCAARSSAPLANIDQADLLETLGEALPLHSARLVTESLEQAIERLENNINARLLAEVILLDWPKLTL